MEYFVHSKKGKALKKEDLPKLEEFVKKHGYKLETSVLENGIIDNFIIESQKNSLCLIFDLTDRNNDEERDEYFYAYFIKVSELDKTLRKETYQILHFVSNALNFVYEDPQRGIDNLEPIEFIDPQYSKKELKKIEEDKIRFSPESYEKVKEKIKKKSFSLVYAFNCDEKGVTDKMQKFEMDTIDKLEKQEKSVVKISFKDNERYITEEFAEEISEISPVIFVSMYEDPGYQVAGSIVYFYKKEILAIVDYDAVAKISAVENVSTKLYKIFNLDKKEFELAYKNTSKDLKGFIENILKLSDISLWK